LSDEAAPTTALPVAEDLQPPPAAHPAVTAANDLLAWAEGRRWKTIYADPPWVFTNSTGKIAPQHKRLWRYSVMSMADIQALPVGEIAEERSHLYLWVPNAILPEGLETMRQWGYTYKGNIVWHKVRKDGGSDGRGVGFYYRNVTELVLFGVRGKDMRTLAPARSQVNLLPTRKREHSRKPDELRTTYIERCSPGPYLELFARGPVGRPGWDAWGYEAQVEREEEQVHPMYRGGPVEGNRPERNPSK
jgi:N6-adenosine-specific RNA methylase IME4